MTPLTRKENEALKVPLNQLGVSVNVGKDGAWMCLKSTSGKSIVFQPATSLIKGNLIDTAVKDWCADMQKLYENSEVERDMSFKLEIAVFPRKTIYGTDYEYITDGEPELLEFTAEQILNILRKTSSIPLEEQRVWKIQRLVTVPSS